MKCPYCSYPESKVVDSRHSDDGLSIRRRRECLQCQRRFTTYETVESLPIVVVKKDGSRQSFDRNKILNGMLRACEKRPVSLAALETAALDIEKQQAVVDALAALAENGGVLKAGSAGTVETLTLEPGGTVTEAPVAALAPADAGMTATFTLDSGKAEKLAVGAALTLRQGGTAVSTTVRAISAPDENGRVTVTADVPADAGLRKTQPVTASAELSRTTYEMVLPPEAVRMDNKGSYVLRVEQTQTILGLRNVLSRVDVTVLEQSASGVAVEGPLSPQDVLVKSSARPVAAGDSVRVEQP